MKQLLYICLLLSLINAFASKVIMTKNEWVDRLIYVANKKTKYSQEYGYNALRWDGQKFWCDCSNLMKALFNGRDVYNPKINSFQQDTSNTGDVNADGLIQKCSYISTDFSTLKSGEPRLIHMSGHIGAYIGKEVNTDHGVCNVVECTPAWKDGAQFSYVDSKGGRYYGKGGEKRGTWAKHGLPNKWVSY